jgi:hypothetical protein
MESTTDQLIRVSKKQDSVSVEVHTQAVQVETKAVERAKSSASRNSFLFASFSVFPYISGYRVSGQSNILSLSDDLGDMESAPVLFSMVRKYSSTSAPIMLSPCEVHAIAGLVRDLCAQPAGQRRKASFFIQPIFNKYQHLKRRACEILCPVCRWEFPSPN